MQSSSTPTRYSMRWPWALVLACGLLLGYYVLQTYYTPKQHQYQLEFSNAHWIEPLEVAPIAYFRKDVFLVSTPDQAWVEVAATDDFKIFVNGHPVGGEDAVKCRVAGIYDIKKHLKPGTNVIAASIARSSYPGTAQLLVYGRFHEPGGRETSLVSDETWKVATNTGIVEGSENWTSPLVEEELWPKARRSVIRGKPGINWVDTNPLLLQLPTAGSWLMAANAPTEAVFSTSINADHAGQETWIQVASSGDLDLLVNGQIITPPTSAPISVKQYPHLAPTPRPLNQKREETLAGIVALENGFPNKVTNAAAMEKATLEAYDVSYWIKKGANSIVAAVRSDHTPATFFANGFLVGEKGSVERFETSSSWLIGDQATSGRSASRQHAFELGKDGVMPWGYLPQAMARPVDYSSFATFARACLVVSLTAFLVVVLWLLVSAIAANQRRQPLTSAMARDALFHGPIAAGLLLFILPDYDLRFPAGWSFQPSFIIGAIWALVAIRVLHFWTSDDLASDMRSGIERLRQTDFRTALPGLLLVMIMGLGLALRFHNLGYMSFDHDEMGLIAKSKGIFKLGFPYTVIAGTIRWITTYEIVPYPLALSGFIFGYSEWSMRLPACIMGTLSIGVIALMGRRLFNWRTGLFAALVYACMPLDVRWGQNAFYLAQCQFMSLLTIWLFYEAIRVRPLNHKYLTAASITFCATYLSWEGTGFILPALFIALMMVRWNEWWWLKDFHLYRCLFVMGAVVVAQYCSRTLVVSTYLLVGTATTDFSGPSLFFLSANYQPMYYVDHLLLDENHVFFTIFILLGLPFCWIHRGFRYLLGVLVTLFLCHTNFLAALSPRYCYYFQPLVILGGTAGAVMLYDRVVALAHRDGNSRAVRIPAHATGVAVLILLFLQSNEWLMREYELSSRGNEPGMMTRMGLYRYDYRGAAQYVKNHLQPGDRILPGIPHVFAYYTGIPGDYFLNTLLSSQSAYDQLFSQPRLADKFAGLPVVRNLTELREVVYQSRRTWIIFAPYSSFEKLNSPNVLAYLDQTAKVEWESYRAKVMLVERANQPKTVAKTTEREE